MSAQVGIQSRISVMLMAVTAFSTLTITSLMAKRPTITLMKFTPAIRSIDPKVRRAAPVRGFCPIKAARRPRAMEITPFSRARPERLITRLRPINIRAKYSGGPKARAKLARKGAKNVSPISPSVPATKEEIAEIPRAGPALPCLAIS